MAESRDQQNRFNWLGSILVLGLVLSACQSNSETAEGADSAVEGGVKVSKKKGLAGEVASSGADLGFLMTMSWTEARALSPQALEIPPFFRVAAETVEVVKRAADGRPLAVRAKGNVFIEMLFKDVGRVLCREAYISEQEVVMRGKPLLQRGGSVVEGVDDLTVFYMFGPKLRVIGRHRLNNESQMIAAAASGAGPVAGRGSEGFASLPGVAPALPLAGPWGVGGPNPLLPPISPETVSDAVRNQMRAEAMAVEVRLLEPASEAPAPPPQEGPPLPPPAATPVPEGTEQ